jgi:hypothetical protein
MTDFYISGRRGIRFDPGGGWQYFSPGGLNAMRLVRIAYWRGAQAPGWPDPREFVDVSWDPSERESVADYLRRGFVARAYMGKSLCRLCGEAVGSLELSDGVFIWPEGLAHYVEVHDVRLPPRVDNMQGHTERLEEAEVDDDWWRGLTGPAD